MLHAIAIFVDQCQMNFRIRVEQQKMQYTGTGKYNSMPAPEHRRARKSAAAPRCASPVYCILHVPLAFPAIRAESRLNQLPFHHSY